MTYTEFPKPSIEAVLHELAGENFIVPTGYGWVRMHCPFHNDRTPSAAVNHEFQSFHCFSCGREGDGVKLIQRELGLDLKDAIERAKALDSGTAKSKSAKKRRASDLLGRL